MLGRTGPNHAGIERFRIMTSPTQKLFISHAPEDFDLALQLSSYLEGDGFGTSIDNSTTSSHNDKKRRIYESIPEVRALIVLLTSHSLVDEHVKREVNTAIENDIQIYPINLTGEAELKKLLNAEWRYWLSITQILTCDNAREAARKLRFRIRADSASNLDLDLSIRELIIGSWRSLESLFDQIEYSKNSHTYIDFKDLHDQFDNDIAPGFIETSRDFRSADKEFKVENRFIGKMLFGLYIFLQYFDCHSLTIDRANSCGLKGHEIETLIDRYIKMAAISFEYPSAITWYVETQFLWDYQNFMKSCPPLLKSENFPAYAQILTHDYEPFYAAQLEYGLELKGSDYNPETALKAHIFDDLSKYTFYNNVSVLLIENLSPNDLNLALSSINKFLEQSDFKPGELESLAPTREEFQMNGYPTLLLFRTYLLKLLGKEEEVKLAIEEFSLSDKTILEYFFSKSLPASSGNGKSILEQLGDFFLKNYETEKPETTNRITPFSSKQPQLFRRY